MEVRPGYKQTEVGVIPEDWDTASLLGIADCLDNVRVPLNETQRQRMQGDIPYCGANGVLDYVNDSVIDDDIILMAEDGGYFDEYATRPIAYRIVGRCWVNNHAHVLKAKGGFDQAFLFHSLVHKNILPFLASGTRAKLNKSEMERIVVPAPRTEAEQRAIAVALSDVDALLGGLERLIAKKRDLKQAAMQQLLTGQTRLPGFHGEWEVKRIADIASPSSEKNVTGEKLPVLTCSKHFGFMDSLGFFKNQVFSKDLSTYRVIRRDEIGYPANHVEEGSIGLQDLYDIALVSPIYVVFRVIAEVSSFFLHRLLKLDSYRQRFKTATTSSVDRRGSLRWRAFSEITVELPPTKPEQTAIAGVLSDMDAELAALEARRDKTRDLKQAMMQELLTGKTRLVKPEAAHA